MGNFLLLSIALIFVFALASSFMRHRHLDRVLRELTGFHVTLQYQSERVWGKFKLYSNAVELLFSQSFTNHRGSHITSFIVFKEQMGGVEIIYRFHDELTPENQQRRLAQIALARNPDFMSRSKRTLRNFMVAFREAISESIGLMANRVQQHTTMAMLKGANGKLKDMGNNILDIAGNAAYDPVLEHYIFSRVVFETETTEGKKTEYTGILEEYSSAWVSILDCYLNAENEISLIDASRLMIQRKMDFEIGLDQINAGVKLSLKIINTDSQDIKIQHIRGAEGFEYKIGKTLAPGAVLDIYIENLSAACLSNVETEKLPVSLKLIAPERQAAGQSEQHDGQSESEFPLLPELNLTFQTCRRADIYIPRSKGLLRHGSEYVD